MSDSETNSYSYDENDSQPNLTKVDNEPLKDNFKFPIFNGFDNNPKYEWNRCGFAKRSRSAIETTYEFNKKPNDFFGCDPLFNFKLPKEKDGYSSMGNLLVDFQELARRSDKWSATIECDGRYHLNFNTSDNRHCHTTFDRCNDGSYSMETLQEDIDLIKNVVKYPEFSIRSEGTDKGSMTISMSSSPSSEDSSYRFENLKYQIRDTLIYGFMITGFLALWKYYGYLQQEYPSLLQVELI